MPKEAQQKTPEPDAKEAKQQPVEESAPEVEVQLALDELSLGSPSPPSPPPSTSPGTVTMLQRSAGNRAVQRLMDPEAPTGRGKRRDGGNADVLDLAQRVGESAVPEVQRINDFDLIGKAEYSRKQAEAAREASSTRERVQQAVDSEDVGDIKAIWDFKNATDPERIKFLWQLVRSDDWFGLVEPMVRIWNSFGKDRIVEVASTNQGLWSECLKEGMDPSRVRALKPLRDSFSEDVKGVAADYMQQNKEFVESEMAQLGIGAAEAASSPTAETEQALRLEATQELAKAAVEAFDAQDKLKQIHVGWNIAYQTKMGPSYSKASFNPNKQPHTVSPPRGYQQEEKPAKTWEQVKPEWDKTVAALNAIGKDSPTIYAAMAKDRDNVKEIAEGTPEQALRVAKSALSETYKNILETIPKLGLGQAGPGDLDWRDLQPIHAQLYAGQVRGPSGTNWSGPLQKSVAKDVIGDYESAEFWKALGLGALGAGLFVVASLATGGLATAAFVGGIAAGAGQAAKSWEQWEDLDTAAKSGASSETELVSDGQADAALISALLDTVFAFIDLAPALRAGRAMVAGRELAELVAKRGAAGALEEASKKGLLEGGQKAAEAVTSGIDELGVQAVLNRTGKSIDDLLAVVKEGPAAARLKAAKEAGLAPTDAGLEVGTKAAAIGVKPGDDAWKGNRGIGELLDEVVPAVANGTISKEFADKLVAEAIERFGPLEAIRRGGGWDALSKALTDSSTEASSRLLSWRDAVLKDLEGYISDLGGKVETPGSAGKLSNDVDASLMGDRSIEMKGLAEAYLAKRLGFKQDTERNLKKLLDLTLFSDPHRAHAFDALPAALREEIAEETARLQRQLMENRRLWGALNQGDEVLVKEIRAHMRKMKIGEFDYKPLSSGDVVRLGKRMDRLDAQLTEALKGGDTALQKKLAHDVAQGQAMINVSSTEAYVGGGVRKYVSEREGQELAARVGWTKGMTNPERLTAVMDELLVSQESLFKVLSGDAGEVVTGVRSLAKHGKRLAKTTGDARGFPETAWSSFIERCDELKAAASGGETAKRLAKGEADAVVREAKELFADLNEMSRLVLATARALPEDAVSAKALMKLTRGHMKTLRVADHLIGHIEIVARAVRTGSRLVDMGVVPETDALTEPDSLSQSLDVTQLADWEIHAELGLISDWLDAHRESSPDIDILLEAQRALAAEKQRRTNQPAELESVSRTTEDDVQ